MPVTWVSFCVLLLISVLFIGLISFVCVVLLLICRLNFASGGKMKAVRTVDLMRIDFFSNYVMWQIVDIIVNLSSYKYFGRINFYPLFILDTCIVTICWKLFKNIIVLFCSFVSTVVGKNSWSSIANYLAGSGLSLLLFIYCIIDFCNLNRNFYTVFSLYLKWMACALDYVIISL